MSPTHYIVLEDTAGMAPYEMQRYAYHTTFMYYNWFGTISVPAMCKVSAVNEPCIPLYPRVAVNYLLIGNHFISPVRPHAGSSVRTVFEYGSKSGPVSSALLYLRG